MTNTCHKYNEKDILPNHNKGLDERIFLQKLQLHTKQIIKEAFIIFIKPFGGILYIFVMIRIHANKEKDRNAIILANLSNLHPLSCFVSLILNKANPIIIAI